MIGGVIEEPYGACAKVDAISVRDGRIESLPDMLHPRNYCTVATRGKRIFVFGGELQFKESIATCEFYSLQDNS